MKKSQATFICCISIAIMAMSITMLSPLLPQIADRFHLTNKESGLLFSVNFFAFAIFTLFGGAIAERFGKKILLTVSLFGLSASCILLSFSDSFNLVLLLMFAYGGFGGIIETFISALISDLNPENPAYYINLSQVFFGIGAIIAPISAGYILMKGYSYTVCYLALGIFSFIVAVAFLSTPIPRQNGGSLITMKDLKTLGSNKMFWLTCVCMCCYTGAEVGTWGWMTTFLSERFQFSIFHASLVLSSFWFAMTIGRFLCGIVSRKVPIAKLIFALSLCAALVTIIFGFGNSSFFYIDSLLLGLACSSQFPFILSFGERFVKRGKNTAFALFMIGSNIGSVTVPYIMGATSDTVSAKSAMLVPAFFFFVVSIIFVQVISTQKEREVKL